MAGLDLDDELSESLINSAWAWFNKLKNLTEILIPRCLFVKGNPLDTISLQTFVNASENAYGAVVYVRYRYEDGSISTNIVAAKTGVTLNKAMSIQRLELMGAVTGVRLSTRISRVLELQTGQSVFWSDSLNVLWWIRGRSWEFNPFVAKRVCKIQTNTNPEQWKYVPTSLNFADILRRGMKADDLIDCDR